MRDAGQAVATMGSLSNGQTRRFPYLNAQRHGPDCPALLVPDTFGAIAYALQLYHESLRGGRFEDANIPNQGLSLVRFRRTGRKNA